MPHTIKDWPRRQSPAAKTPSTFVEYCWSRMSCLPRSDDRPTYLGRRLNIRSDVLLDAQRSDHLWLGTQESERQEDQLCREELLRSWHFLHLPPPAAIFRPLDPNCFWDVDGEILVDDDVRATHQCLDHLVCLRYPQQIPSLRCYIPLGLAVRIRISLH